MAKYSDKQIRDIAEKRKRTPAPDTAASWRMASLLQSFNSPTKHRAELLRYFPIAVVSTIEGYFRTRLARLIDSGEPFITNAVKAYPKIQLDVTLARAMVAKEVTLGELITHPLSMSSFDSLIEIVTSITGIPGFLSEVEAIKAPHLGARKNETVIQDAAATRSHLGKVFAQRHILCHELATNEVVEDAETRELLLSAQQFIRASSEWLQKLENPHPKSRTEKALVVSMNSLDEAKRRLNSTLSQLEQEGLESTLSTIIPSILQKAEKSLDSYVRGMQTAERQLAKHSAMTLRGTVIDESQLTASFAHSVEMLGMLGEMLHRHLQIEREMRELSLE